MRLSGQDLCVGMAGDEVAELHGELIRLGFAIPDSERRDHLFGVGTAQGGSGGITGKLYLECGGPAADIRLRAYRRGFGGTATRLGEEARTERDGSYEIRYATDGAPVNLELRAVQTHSNEVSEVSLTDTVFAVAQGQVLNVVAPASVRPLGAEYRQLLADVKPHLGERRLGAAKETAEQPDLTLLQESTGRRPGTHRGSGGRRGRTSTRPSARPPWTLSPRSPVSRDSPRSRRGHCRARVRC